MKKLLLLCMMVLTGCSMPRWSSNGTINFSPDSKSIRNDSSLYVSLPEDGQYGRKAYPASGQAVQTELVSQLSSVFNKVNFAFKTKSLEDDLVDAKKKKANFLVVPTITHWEDRNTAWSYNTDKIGLFIEIIDTTNENSVNSARLSAEGPNRAFVNQHPESLLPRILEDYVNLLQ